MDKKSCGRCGSMIDPLTGRHRGLSCGKRGGSELATRILGEDVPEREEKSVGKGPEAAAAGTVSLVPSPAQASVVCGWSRPGGEWVGTDQGGCGVARPQRTPRLR